MNLTLKGEYVESPKTVSMIDYNQTSCQNEVLKVPASNQKNSILTKFSTKMSKYWFIISFGAILHQKL